MESKISNLKMYLFIKTLYWDNGFIICKAFASFYGKASVNLIEIKAFYLKIISSESIRMDKSADSLSDFYEMAPRLV